MNAVEFLDDIRILKAAILKSRYTAARLANVEMLKLYYAIGCYVSAKTRKGAWGKGAIEEVSLLLSKELPGLRGFSATNIKNMRLFFEEWAHIEFCQTMSGELSRLQSGSVIEIRQTVSDELGPSDLGAFQSIGFSHHMAIIFACKKVDERLYYIRKCATNFWSFRSLQEHLRAKEYETDGRVVNNFMMTLPDELQIGRAIQAFRSEYLLDFVNIVDLNETEQERDEPEWMMDMVTKIRHFIHALGSDFCFMDVKKRFVVGESEFYADLVFFHRQLKCMVAIELKKGDFKPEYLGQLDFYLACLDKFEKREEENPSIGLLLCRKMDRPVVELAVRRYKTPLGVATYQTSADVPEEYRALRPLMDGALKLLTADDIAR